MRLPDALLMRRAVHAIEAKVLNQLVNRLRYADRDKIKLQRIGSGQLFV